MNVVSIESVSPDALSVSTRADSSGADLFSVLMGSVAAVSIPQQGGHNSLMDDMADFTGAVSYSYGNGPSQTSEKGMPVDVPANGAAADEVAGTMPMPFLGKSADISLANEAAESKLLINPTGVSFQDENLIFAKVYENQQQPYSFGSLQVTLNPVSDGEEAVLAPLLLQEGSKGRSGVLPEQTRMSFRPAKGDENLLSQFVVSEVFNRESDFKSISPIEPFRNDENLFSEQDKGNSHPGNKTGILGKTAAGSFVQPDPKALEEDPGLLTAAQPFLQQAVKGAKTWNGIEGNEASIAAIGKGEIATAKNADTGIEISPAVSQNALNPGHSNISSKLVAEDGKDFQTARNPAIEPANLIAQVSGKIKADFKGEGGEVRMELHPESLGHLKIEIKVESGAVRANILTENAMVRDAIDSNLPMLKSSLEGHGLRIDQLSVGVDQRQGGGNFAERNGFHGWQEPNGRNALYQEEGGTSDGRSSGYAHQEEAGLSIFA